MQDFARILSQSHIGLAIRAFLRLEVHWFATGISWYEAKLAIVRIAVRDYLAAPCFILNPTAELLSKSLRAILALPDALALTYKLQPVHKLMLLLSIQSQGE